MLSLRTAMIALPVALGVTGAVVAARGFFGAAPDLRESADSPEDRRKTPPRTAVAVAEPIPPAETEAAEDPTILEAPRLSEPQKPRGATAAKAAADSALAEEARLVGAAQESLLAGRDAARSLALLDEHRARFANGKLKSEAMVARVDALLALGRRKQALEVMDRIALAGLPRGRELQVLRGELRAEAERCLDAVADFDAILSRMPDGAAAERALYGRASCRARQGDESGARADLAAYLSRYPRGRFAVPARSALGP